MAGELRLSQFRFTTTSDDDFVIGNPATGSSHTTKTLVFQTDDTPGRTGKPHLRCEWDGAAWGVILSQDGSTDTKLTGLAYVDESNNFQIGYTNTFAGTTTLTGAFNASGTSNITGAVTNITGATVGITGASITLGTLTSNTLTIHSNTHMYSDLLIDGNLTISGTTTNINTTNVEVKDKLIRLNNGSVAADANGSGIEVEESSDGNITGYVKIGNSRASWEFLAPAKSGTIWLTPSAGAFNTNLVSTATAGRSINLPNADGTLALFTDIPTAFSGTANRAVITSAGGALTVSTVTNTEIGYLSGVTSSIQTQLTNLVTTNTVQDITGPKTFKGSIGLTSDDTVGIAYTSVLVMARTKTGDATWGGQILIGHGSANDGFMSQYYSYHSTTAKMINYLGIGGSSSASYGSVLKRVSGKVTLEVASDGAGAGSGLILWDTVTSARYELTMASGVLTVTAL